MPKQPCPPTKVRLLTIVFFACALYAAAQGVQVKYSLPSLAQDASQPQTYLVTLAITAPDNPDWILSTFVAGQPRTVTAENKGLFVDTWNGLDENFMPLPPGSYGIKGIYTPAEYWEVDEAWHAITPHFVGGVSAWLPDPKDPDHWKRPIPFKGDPVNSPLRDVDVAPNGVAVFYYQYLENGLNAPMFDLNKPLGYGQFIASFNSGGAAGGSSIATDGETTWAASGDGGPKFLYRTDQKPFGNQNGAHRKNVTILEGKVTSMDAWKDPVSGKSYVYVAQRGQIIEAPKTNPRHKYGKFYESEDLLINDVTIYDGANADVLAKVSVPNPKSILLQNSTLYTLSQKQEQWIIGSVDLENGLPTSQWQPRFTVPEEINPFDMQLDSKGRFYLSDSAANKVYQLNNTGKIKRTFGRLAEQKPGSYDPLTFMSPAKMAMWQDAEGIDRLIVVEYAGPNRVSEWNVENGQLIQEYPSYQTRVNNGYAIDPAEPSKLYIPAHDDWLTRYQVDYENNTWTIDAVWPNIKSGQHADIDKPIAIRANDNTLYLAGGRQGIIYRLDPKDQQFYKSAGILQQGKRYNLWSDANGNGDIEESEIRPGVEMDGQVLMYHGQRFLEDLSYLSPAYRGQSVWRLPVDHFDTHGNPVYTQWQKVLTDPIFTARQAGTATVFFGGNELADSYNSNWMMADGSVAEGYYVHARGGKNLTANYGAQYKISRYVPDGNDGYKIKWRVGRSNMMRPEKAKGDLIGGSRLFKPINGILTVIDQSRSGLYLYTDDGLYIDTIFPAETINKQVGVYRQPGEFFAGSMFANHENGKIYYASGKYTPFLYEMENWNLQQNPVQRLTTLPKTINIQLNQISPPLPLAVMLRGGEGKASLAPFAPAVGDVALDGSLSGWESVSPVSYGTGKDQKVEVRCLYDPEHLYLRWHVRVGGEFELKAMPPLERIFTHDQESDTVSFYIQGDTNASVKKSDNGRPGDVRIVFGLFEQNDRATPVAVGMYPTLQYEGAESQTYSTPVGSVTFEHVGAIRDAELASSIDADAKGYVIAAKIPRTAIPAIAAPFSGDFHTLVNFSANLGGHNKFWWSNTDGSANIETYDEPSEARLYPGAWAPAKFQGLTDGYTIRNWQKLGPFGGPGAEAFQKSPKKKAQVKQHYDAAHFPPDQVKVDLEAIYTGAQIQGYWQDPKEVHWEPVSINDLDTRALVGYGAQVWYGATWIYAPKVVELDFELQGHRMTYIHWFLNDTELKAFDPDKDYQNEPAIHSLKTATRRVTLQQGWNQVFYRAYNVGYPPFKIGLVLKAPPETLWSLRFSNQLPE